MHVEPIWRAKEQEDTGKEKHRICFAFAIWDKQLWMFCFFRLIVPQRPHGVRAHMLRH